MHEMLWFTLCKLASNPGENMLQLLVHPDSVFYMLLTESPTDDIRNEPCRKPLSSLEGPGGKNWLDCFPFDPAFLFDRQRG